MIHRQRKRIPKTLPPEVQDDPISGISGDEPAPMTEEEIEQIVWTAMERVGIDPTQHRINENIRFKPDELLYQFLYHDPLTGVSYEVVYDFDFDDGQAVVAYALVGQKKARLTRDLKQRMALAAFEHFVRVAIEEEYGTDADTAFCT